MFGILLTLLLLIIAFVVGYKTSNTCHVTPAPTGRVCQMALKSLK